MAVAPALAWGAATSGFGVGAGMSTAGGVVDVSQKIGWLLAAGAALFFIADSQGQRGDDDDDDPNGNMSPIEQPIYVRIDEDAVDIYRRGGQLPPPPGGNNGPWDY